ncbi:phosphoribosyltransferase domain-containing protein [Deinococcus sp.]|uniref:phosphoribosyltransferase domain-containing protein n=1 Tax=Deinococcus sp. TaxID=47478 RepID=UPI0025BEC32F|nr:phosphoribosyltransferase domain-containing protein [Deinococcus sp.]
MTLPSGRLDLHLERSALPLGDLLEFAVRRNPKRGFLFVSRVLGKHIPIRPQVAADTHAALASALPPLTAPHFIGLAETATALGEGVFRAWQARQGGGQQAAHGGGRVGGTFQHTTRYLSGHPLLLRFDEPHSHAPAHLVYDPGAKARAARELVLVDDELSTGTTLENLAREWLALHPHVRHVVLVSLTDWCVRRSAVQAALGVPVDFVSLSSGTFEFTPDPAWTPAALPAVTGDGGDRSHLLPARSVRYGHPDALHLPGDPADLLALTDLADLTGPAGPVLVLGTGEYQFPAFALARALEEAGLDVRWSATTRSPVLPGLAIRHALTFTDNVGDGIPNYLYNVAPQEYARILVAFEGDCQPDPALMSALGPQARAVRLT